MELKNKRITFTLTLIYGLLLTLIASFYFVYSNNFYKSLSIKYASQNQEVFASELENQINLLFNDDHDELVKKGAIVDNQFVFNDNLVDVDRNIFKNYNFGFLDTHIYIHDKDNYYIYDISTITKNINDLSKAQNILLIDNQGVIYYQKENTNTNLLNQYIDTDISSYYTDYLSKNENVVIKTKINKNESYLSFASIDNFENLYLVEVFDNSFLRPLYFQYNIFFILFLVVISLTVILTQLYIFRSIHIKNAEIESSRFTYLYAKPYIFKVNRRGKIVKVNRKIRKEVKDYTDYKNINDLIITDKPKGSKVEILLKREEAFTASFPNKVIRFIPLKTVRHYFLVGEDISNFESDLSEMHALAYYDEITTLPNFNYYKNEVNKMIKSSDYNPKTTASIIVDINGFSMINKVFGANNANILLFQMGNIISEFAREINGVVYNPEDDKFIIVTSTYNEKEDVINMVKELQSYLEKPIDVLQNKIKVKLEAGIFFFDTNPEEQLTAKRVYSKLLDTLTRVKESSIHNYIVYDDNLKLYVSQQNMMTQDLIKAIRKEELTVFLQPQYNNELEKIVGFEALLRWDNPKYANVSPQKYIMIAENNNLIIDIGKQIIEQSFKMAEQLKDYDVTISINISPVQIMQEGFVDEFLDMFKKYNLNKNSISIEITETFLMTSFRIINEKLKILRREGIKIHLDDFGTGYSSLPYIKELSIDTIKIDRSFIRHIETDKKDKEIVNMLLTLSKNLDLDVIAEGVETANQNEYLYKRGCNIIQGFILSPAVKLEDAIILLEEYNINKTKTLKQTKRGKNK